MERINPLTAATIPKSWHLKRKQSYQGRFLEAQLGCKTPADNIYISAQVLVSTWSETAQGQPTCQDVPLAMSINELLRDVARECGRLPSLTELGNLFGAGAGYIKLEEGVLHLLRICCGVRCRTPDFSVTCKPVCIACPVLQLIADYSQSFIST